MKRLFAMAMLLLSSSCLPAVQAEKADVSGPPDWTLNLPRDKAKIYAVGISEPAYYRDSAVTTAGENCRKELARSLEIQLSTAMVDRQNTRGQSVDEATVTEVSASVTEKVLQESEAVSVWYDECGAGPMGRKGLTYLLCRVGR